MSVDCNSSVIWGGVVSDSSDEETTSYGDVKNETNIVRASVANTQNVRDDVRPDVADIRLEFEDVRSEIDDVTTYIQDSSPLHKIDNPKSYTGAPYVTWLNGEAYPENEANISIEPVHNGCDDLTATDAKGSNIFAQLETEFTGDDQGSRFDSPHVLSGKEETALPDEQILKMKYFCHNHPSDIIVSENEVDTVVTLESAQQLISAVDSRTFQQSDSGRKCSDKISNKSPLGVLSANSMEDLAEKRRLSIEKKIVYERTCQKCNIYFNTAAAKVSHDVTFHLVPTLESERVQKSGQSVVPEQPEEPDEIVSCSVCTYTDSKKNNFNVSCHRTILHLGKNFNTPNQIRCYFCRLVLKCQKLSSEDQNVFWLTVHVPKKDHLMCYLCGLVVPKKSAMKRHLLVHKDSENSHVCKVCRINFTFEEMKNHIISQRCIEDIFRTEEKQTKCITSCEALSSSNLSTKSVVDFFGNPVAEIVHIPDNLDVHKVLKSCKSNQENSEHVSTSRYTKNEQSLELPPCFEGTNFSDESETWTRYLHSNVYVQQVEYYYSRGKAEKSMSKKPKSTDAMDKLKLQNESCHEDFDRPKKKRKLELPGQSLPIQIVVSSVKSLAQ